MVTVLTCCFIALSTCILYLCMENVVCQGSDSSSLINADNILTNLKGYKKINIIRSSRIVGGAKVESIENYPYQVLLKLEFEYGEFPFCGGTLIRPSVVLTAAHCILDLRFVPNFIRYMRAQVGSLSSKDEGAKKVEVEDIIIHDDYNDPYGSHANDIAIIVLSENVTFTSKILPASLPSTQATASENDVFVVSGWGSLGDVRDENPTDLYTVDVAYVDNVKCQKLYDTKDTKILPTMMCAGNLTNSGADACQGDSGGPLILKGTTILYGITSFGFGCGDSGIPGIYTFVPKYIPWITENIKDIKNYS